MIDTNAEAFFLAFVMGALIALVLGDTVTFAKRWELFKLKSRVYFLEKLLMAITWIGDRLKR